MAKTARKSRVRPPVIQRIPTEPKIKFVKKAGLWVKTWFEFDRNNKPVQKQEWAATREALNG